MFGSEEKYSEGFECYQECEQYLESAHTSQEDQEEGRRELTCRGFGLLGERTGEGEHSSCSWRVCCQG